jgi:probable phosphoglycerate mutase
MVVVSIRESRARQVGNVLRRIEKAFLLGVEGVTEVWLVRHADAYEDDWSEDDDPPLSAGGREQAARLAARARRLPFDAVYASPMRRALETAKAIRDDVRIDERLVEMDAEMSEAGTLEFTEPADRVGRRMREAVSDAVAAHPGGRVLMLGHGASILCYIGDLLGNEFGSLRVFPYFTSVSVIRVLGDLHVVGSLVDVAHLDGA